MNEDTVYYEDIKEDMVFKSSIGRTITDTDNIWFSLLTNNSNQIHFNKDYVEKNYNWPPFNGRLIVNGLLTLSIAVGLTTQYTSRGGIMLGLENIRFLNPVFSGDTIYVESIVSEKRISRSRPGYGICRFHTRVYNQENQLIMEFDRIVLLKRRSP